MTDTPENWCIVPEGTPGAAGVRDVGADAVDAWNRMRAARSRSEADDAYQDLITCMAIMLARPTVHDSVIEAARNVLATANQHPHLDTSNLRAALAGIEDRRYRPPVLQSLSSLGQLFRTASERFKRGT